MRGDLFIMLAGVRVLKHLSEFIRDTHMTFDTLCNILLGEAVECVFGGMGGQGVCALWVSVPACRCLSAALDDAQHVLASVVCQRQPPTPHSTLFLSTWLT